MATMLLAAAGSVGGTVAWFSANTAFNTTISSFKVVRLNGDLKYQMVEGYGTNVNAAGDTVTLEDYAELTHGSFDHNTGHVFNGTNSGTYTDKATISKSGGTAGSGAPTNLQAGSYKEGTNTHVVWHVVTWHMTFIYELSVQASTADKTNLYFDLEHSDIPAASVETYANSGESLETKKGFRIAFYPDTTVRDGENSQQTHVWAGAQIVDGAKYVDYNSGTPASTAYSGNTLWGTNTSADADDGDADGLTSANNCLGQFVSFTTVEGKTTSKIGFTCVAWFEGEDANVVNASKMQSLSVSLAFFTLSNRTA